MSKTIYEWVPILADSPLAKNVKWNPCLTVNSCLMCCNVNTNIFYVVSYSSTIINAYDIK